MNIRYILIIVVVVALLCGGIYFAWNLFSGGTVETPVVEAPAPQAPAINTFASSTLGMFVSYPAAYILNDSYAYDAFGQSKLIQGVKFTVSAIVATGTALLPDSGVSVEWLPNAHACTGDIYLKANVKSASTTDGATTYSLATSTTAVAGGQVEEMVYALPASKPCTAVRYYIHTSSDMSLPPYDRAALLAQFDTIRRSVVVTQ